MGMIGVYILTDEATMNKLSDSDELFEELEDYQDEETTVVYNIDKLWDGLHFLLTGESAEVPIEGDPLSEAIVGTHVFDCDDYFIAYTAPDEIPAILTALNKVDINTLISEVDLSSFAEANIYPKIWAKENDELLKNELKQEFLNLKDFYEKASNAKTGMLVSIY